VGFSRSILGSDSIGTSCRQRVGFSDFGSVAARGRHLFRNLLTAFSSRKLTDGSAYQELRRQNPLAEGHHCHCKDAVKKPDGSGYEWAAMGRGSIDWVGQFKALKRDGYHFAVSLETHWRGAGTPEESTRQSWAGMKRELQEARAI